MNAPRTPTCSNSRSAPPRRRARQSFRTSASRSTSRTRAERKGYDPVTVADHAAEAVIRAAIARAYPDHGIRGEEHGTERGASKYTWVIDPIDGTRSFILGQMHWATLIALQRRRRRRSSASRTSRTSANRSWRTAGGGAAMAARRRAAHAEDASLPEAFRRGRRLHRSRRCSVTAARARGVRPRRRPRPPHPLGRRLLRVLPARDGTDRHRDRGVAPRLRRSGAHADRRRGRRHHHHVDRRARRRGRLRSSPAAIPALPEVLALWLHGADGIGVRAARSEARSDWPTVRCRSSIGPRTRRAGARLFLPRRAPVV